MKCIALESSVYFSITYCEISHYDNVNAIMLCKREKSCSFSRKNVVFKQVTKDLVAADVSHRQ